VLQVAVHELWEPAVASAIVPLLGSMQVNSDRQLLLDSNLAQLECLLAASLGLLADRLSLESLAVLECLQLAGLETLTDQAGRAHLASQVCRQVSCLV